MGGGERFFACGGHVADVGFGEVEALDEEAFFRVAGDDGGAGFSSFFDGAELSEIEAFLFYEEAVALGAVGFEEGLHIFLEGGGGTGGGGEGEEDGERLHGGSVYGFRTQERRLNPEGDAFQALLIPSEEVSHVPNLQ